MLVSELLDTRYRLLTAAETATNEFSGCYAGDLLSIVMKSARSKNLLITVIPNLNTVAVAVLVDLPVVIFAEGNLPAAETILKANAESIALISTPLKTYEVVLDLSKRGLV